ncbi:MAG: VanZ family protein [Verrucomicrobiales bacterium]|nr:VanZ family protein [Verrucomicrobiales bacterium]
MICIDWQPELLFYPPVSERCPRIICFLKRWLPVLAWMTIIFAGSTDLLSSRNTSRVIGPILRWFKRDVSTETIARVQLAVRKSGHVAEYAILAILVWCATRTAEDASWSWRAAWLALVIVAVYAATDEVHQAFVATRQGTVVDVVIDVGGGTAGLALLWCWGKWRRHW